MLLSSAASASASAPASALPPKPSSLRSINHHHRHHRAGPPRCIDGRAGRCVVARAAPAGGGAPRSPDATAAARAADRSGVAASAAAAAAAAAPPAPAPPTDDIAVTGIASTFASYEDPADGPPSAALARRLSLLLSAVGAAEGQRGGAAEEPSLADEAARLESLIERLRACGDDLQARLAVVEADPRVAALREATSATHAGLWIALERLPASDRFLALALPAIGQAHVLALPPPVDAAAPSSSSSPSADDGAACVSAWSSALESLCTSLARVEAFYDSMGGLVGYQLASLRLVIEGAAALEAGGKSGKNGSNDAADTTAEPATAETTKTDTYHVPPPTLDLAAETPEARAAGARAVAAGVRATPFLAEIWPVGGAGDRLGLQCESTGEPLPAAMLPYAGRPILESLVRDLQAREYLHWKITGRQCTTPLAIMTSDAKGNDRRIRALIEGARWYGRGRSSVRLVRQPLVPVLDASDGRWLLAGPCSPAMKPGGHGAIWKLLRDEGVFSWLQREQGRSAALLRQISNPMAGTDTTLLALAGAGYSGQKEFGFMSCERVVGAAEGMNVLRRRRRRGGARERQGGAASADNGDGAPSSSAAPSSCFDDEYVLTNVEYTEFEKLGMSDVPAEEGSATSAFPANTNILYVGLGAAENAVDRAVAAGGGDVLPGLIFNLKKKVAYSDPLQGGEVREVRAGRMESTMQNLADQLGTRVAGSAVEESATEAAASALPAPSSLSTFLVRNVRRKVTSSAKKKRPLGGYQHPHSLHQTPDGSFLDLMNNARELLLEKCSLRYVPPVGDFARYLERGPGFVALFHPALGPLWDVIGQKIRGGAIMDGSELVLEVAEARLREVTVEGSLLVQSDSPLGHTVDSSPSSSAPSSSPSSEGGKAQGEATTADDDADDDSRLVFSSRCGRASLSNVEVRNVGVDWRHPSNEPWRHRLVRHESCRVVLRGCAEFEAFDCRITGDALFEVPDGHRMVVTQAPVAAAGVGGAAGPSSASASVFQVGDLLVVLEPLRRSEADGQPLPSWEWRYSMDESTGHVRLECRRNAPLAPCGGVSAPSSAASSASPAAWASPLPAAAASRLDAAAEAAAAALDVSLAGDIAAAARAAAVEREQQEEEADPALAAAARARLLAADGNRRSSAQATAVEEEEEDNERGAASPSSTASATMYMQHDEVRTVPHYTI